MSNPAIHSGHWRNQPAFLLATMTALLLSVSAASAQSVEAIGLPVAEPEPAVIDSDCATCGDSACHGAGCLDRWRAAHAEKQHLQYLLSMRGGTAEYTHQWNQYHAAQMPWNGSYYHTEWGAPLVLLAPPTAQYQTRWSWGVGRTTSVPLYHQFARPYPGDVQPNAAQLFATPWWPSHTDQFGVYYIRAPW